MKLGELMQASKVAPAEPNLLQITNDLQKQVNALRRRIGELESISAEDSIRTCGRDICPPHSDCRVCR